MFGKGSDDTDVVSMTARSEARRAQPLRVVETYWHALHDGTEVPLRSAVDPRGMESALENAFLLERIAPTMAKIRVAGTHLSDVMGMEVAGMPLSTLIAAEDRERFGEMLAHVFADPAIIRLRFEAQQGFGRPSLTAQMIVLPLRSDFGEVTRALGAFVTEGRIGRAPRRFRLTAWDIESAGTTDSATVGNRGETVRPVRPERPAVLTERPVAEIVVPASAAHTPREGRAGEGRAHLRLVVSND